MAQKITIAIIGAATAVGTLIARSIAANFRVLLMDTKPLELELLQVGIRGAVEAAELDVLHCCKNATWEADMIIVAYGGKNLNQIALMMDEVSNRKAVLHFTSNQNDIGKLQQLLPYAEVVTILWSQPFRDATTDAFISGRNVEATDTAKMIVAAMGWHAPLP